MDKIGLVEILAVGGTFLGAISVIVNAWLQSQREKITNDIKYLKNSQEKIEILVDEMKEEMIKSSVKYPHEIAQIQEKMDEFKQAQALQNEILNTIMIKLIKRIED